MALELLGFAIIGCLLGIVTGLIPGLHVNTIALIALSFPKENGLGMAILIACMSIVHSFVDFVPSVLFGAPSEETFLGVLPGHKLLLEGKGLIAVKLTVVGGLFAGLASIAISPLFVLFAEKSQGFLSQAIPFMLAAILGAMVLGEKGRGKILFALAVVSLSGLLGFLALKSMLPLQQPLFCLATGFFGASALVDSILKKPVLKEQKNERLWLGNGIALKSSALALAGGFLVSLMPGIGASQAAFIVRKLVGRIRTREYLVLLGGVNTSTMIFSFFMLFALGKTRTGAAAAMGQLLDFGFREIMLVSAACLVALGFGAIAADLAARPALNLVKKVDYRKLNLIVLALVTGLVFFFSGFLGLAFYAIAASIGLLAINSGIKRSNTMAFLMIPTILNYIAFF